MKLHAIKDRVTEKHEVWVSLDETPTSGLFDAPESFCIAVAATRADALMGASNVLDEASKACAHMAVSQTRRRIYTTEG